MSHKIITTDIGMEYIEVRRYTYFLVGGLGGGSVGLPALFCGTPLHRLVLPETLSMSMNKFGETGSLFFLSSQPDEGEQSVPDGPTPAANASPHIYIVATADNKLSPGPNSILESRVHIPMISGGNRTFREVRIALITVNVCQMVRAIGVCWRCPTSTRVRVN